MPARWIVAIASGMAVLFLAACSANRPMPAERPENFSAAAYWDTGSLPPPYHYEITIEVGPGEEGRLALQLGYSPEEQPPLERTFTVSAGALDDLYARLVELGVFSRTWQDEEDPPVGGSLQGLTVTAGEREVRIPAYVQGKADAQAAADAYQAVRDLVPPELWDWVTLEQAAYERKTGG